MSNSTTYVGPGTNILPAIKYLRSKNATSESTAISLEDIKSEDFKRLIQLNAQTSMWIGVTPEGKYWLRSIWLYFFIILGVIFFITVLVIIIMVTSSVFTRSTGIFQLIGNTFK